MLSQDLLVANLHFIFKLVNLQVVFPNQIVNLSVLGVDCGLQNLTLLANVLKWAWHAYSRPRFKVRRLLYYIILLV